MEPWETLGISKGASKDEIDRAWRKKAFQFHPDRGGDAADFKRALFAYEILSARWEANSVNVGSTSGEKVSQPTGDTFEQNKEFQQYAEAYYEAWYSVPDNVRFWFSFFKFLHAMSLLLAFPLFFGGVLLLVVGILFGRPSPEVITRLFFVVAISGVFVLGVYTKFWDKLRFNLQDKYSFTRARASMSKAVALREKVSSVNRNRSGQTGEATPTVEPDSKGEAAGCAIILAIMLVMAMIGVATAPNLKVHPIVAYVFYGAMFGIPLLALLTQLFKGGKS